MFRIHLAADPADLKPFDSSLLSIQSGLNCLSPALTLPYADYLHFNVHNVLSAIEKFKTLGLWIFTDPAHHF